MPFYPEKVPSRIWLTARQRTLVPLIGAGFSRQAHSEFPNWSGLLEKMRDFALGQEHIQPGHAAELDVLLAGRHFLMVAEELKDRIPTDEYERFLEKTFSPPEARPVEIHRELLRLNAPLILTTNYDLLLEDAYAKEYQQQATICTYRKPEVVQRALADEGQTERPIIFKIHGSISEPEGIILTELDYRNLAYAQLGYRALLSAVFLTRTVLMLGSSFADRELIVLLETLRHSFKHRSSPHYIFLPTEEAGEVVTRRLREDFGLQVILYERTENVPELLEFVQFINRKINSPGTP